MKAKDLAWLASVAEDCKLIYDRKDEVVAELQVLYRIAKEKKVPHVTMNVVTSWAEEEARKRAKEAHEEGNA